MNTVWHDFWFEAAHRLPKTPKGHKCRRWHGHNYRVRVEITGDPDPSGMVADFFEIAKAMRKPLRKLDHSKLNKRIENPTAENIGKWFWVKIAQSFPGKFVQVSVSENRDCGARFYSVAEGGKR